MFNEIIKKVDWNGEMLELSTGKIARQSDSAVMVKMGDSVVQCTAVASKKTAEEGGFLPLVVNYQEKAYSAGKIPGGFFKRDTGKSEKETLISRLIDRPIRPLFHKYFFNDTQILCTVHSFDPKFNTDILALIGASAALAISGIPFLDIVSASRVGMINEEFILNPSLEQMQDSKLDLIVAGTKDSVMMVESEAEFLTESQMLDAVKFGHEKLQPVINLIEELKKEIGKPEMEVVEIVSEELKNDIRDFTEDDIVSAFTTKIKQDRDDAVDSLLSSIKENFKPKEYTELQITLAFNEVKSEILRKNTLDSQTRIDGRKKDQIRQIEGERSLFPSAHGSALFTRGETQAIVSTTLGTGNDEQIIDCISGEYKERFMLNYLFPAYSVGEVSQLRAPSRREIGHGRLAWKALKFSIPSRETFPYAIRVVSEISESNGSSSMATVCGSSMSMMDAGVPLREPIAGIAMGLIKEDDRFIILSDIIADEDNLGDMDFKVAGSSNGITALQMDIKIKGINFEIMSEALNQAKEGRIHILDKMSSVIETHGELNSNAPIIKSFTVNKDKIREIIGPGGKVIKEICESTGAKVDITDDGKVSISAVGKESLNNAINMVKEIAIDPKVGEVFEGKVVKILNAGAFVNYSGSRDGFVHISEISDKRIEYVTDVLKEGQKVKVKLIGFDRGRAKLTIKNVNSKNVLHTEVSPKRNMKRSVYNKPQSENRKNNYKSDSSARVTEKRKYFN